MKYLNYLLVLLKGENNMLDFMKEVFTYDETMDIKDNLPNNILFDLSTNSEEFILIVKYLKGIGINDVSDLVINYHYLFLNTLDEVKDIFSKFSKEEINSINNDYYVLDELM